MVGHKCMHVPTAYHNRNPYCITEQTKNQAHCDSCVKLHAAYDSLPVSLRPLFHSAELGSAFDLSKSQFARLVVLGQCFRLK